jgi:two-component system NarL family response regulator
MREGLSALINLLPEMQVVAEAADGREAVEQFFRHRPDVALIDLRMPQMDGLEVIPAICRRAPGARVVVLTTFADDEDIYRALQLGAKGYLLKQCSSEELLQCVRAVHAGGTYIAPVIAGKLAERLSGPRLSPRELEVLHLLVDGKTNKEIAVLLGIAEATVRVHVDHILEKLGVSSRTAACVTALERGLIRPP